MTLDHLRIVGQGARHTVFTDPASFPRSVYRVEKDEARNTFEECCAKLAYHQRVVSRLFGSFVPTQRIVSLGNLHVIETEYVQLGSICVELKPKWIVHDSFVDIQQRRGYTQIFNPAGLWSRHKTEIITSLRSARSCDKPYLQIHRGDDEGEAIDLVACALMDSEIFSVLNTIAEVSQLASATDCLPIAKKLVQMEKTTRLSPDVLLLEMEAFVSIGKSLLTNPDPELVHKWINTYLTGRMVRDVSLMFSFSTDPSELGKPIFPVGNMFCRLVVIDTELKPRSKISC